MTVKELKLKFVEFGLGNWPKTYEVDSDTYANVCQEIINNAINRQIVSRFADGSYTFSIFIGPNNGVIFKNIELILKRSEDE